MTDGRTGLTKVKPPRRHERQESTRSELTSTPSSRPRDQRRRVEPREAHPTPPERGRNIAPLHRDLIASILGVHGVLAVQFTPIRQLKFPATTPWVEAASSFDTTDATNVAPSDLSPYGRPEDPGELGRGVPGRSRRAPRVLCLGRRTTWPEPRSTTTSACRLWSSERRGSDTRGPDYNPDLQKARVCSASARSRERRRVKISTARWA